MGYNIRATIRSSKPVNFSDVRKRLSKQKGLALYDNDEIEYLKKPLGLAAFTTPSDESIIQDPKSDIKKKPKELAKWNDRVICDICGTEFTRSARSKHKQTQKHQIYLKMHEKIRDLVIKDDIKK